jgi:CheY-like chemotaxis protein
MNSRALNILLVEDNLDHAELVRRHLQNVATGNCLVHVEDGETAMNYLNGSGVYADRKQFPPPDLVLLDLHLPRMEGLEVLRYIRRHPQWNRIPVVVLTTSDAERDAAKAYEHDADWFLTKPADTRQFTKLFKELGLPGGERKS